MSAINHINTRHAVLTCLGRALVASNKLTTRDMQYPNSGLYLHAISDQHNTEERGYDYCAPYQNYVDLRQSYQYVDIAQRDTANYYQTLHSCQDDQLEKSASASEYQGLNSF